MGEAKPLTKLSIVIPARDEEGCIASTVNHLHVELKLKGVPHEIVVVDDGSADSMWDILQRERQAIPELAPVRNEGFTASAARSPRGSTR
jgi:dolichol-phosphate mannosyltransferase